MEANLPEDEKYKNFKRGFASPISVGDQIHAGGDSNHGIQTVAFNLPNDERVREAKGAKKVILQNVLGAKYDRILQPMASLVLVPAGRGEREQALHVPGDPVPRAVATASGRDRSRSTAARRPSTRN